MIDRETCAALADAIYKYAPSGEWQVKNKINSSSGFNGATYVNPSNPSEIVVVFRGTEQSKIEDWLNDITMSMNALPAQFWDAYFYYRDIVKEYPNAKITITGHSLGGALAQLLGAFLEITNDSNYLSTYSFNGPGVSHLLTPIGLIVPNELKLIELIVDTLLKFTNLTNFSTIQNFINMSDLVGNLTNISLVHRHDEIVG